MYLFDGTLRTDPIQVAPELPGKWGSANTSPSIVKKHAVYRDYYYLFRDINGLDKPPVVVAIKYFYGGYFTK